MSPLLGGRNHCVITCGMRVSIMAGLVASCYTSFTLLYLVTRERELDVD